jgi:hypothetical protein
MYRAVSEMNAAVSLSLVLVVAVTTLTQFIPISGSVAGTVLEHLFRMFCPVPSTSLAIIPRKVFILMSATTGIHAVIGFGVALVFGRSDYTQIINSVICLIKVYVVYCVFLYWIVIRDKGKGYELMD